MALPLIAAIGFRIGPSYISRMVNLGYSGATIGKRIASFNWGVSRSWVYGRVKTYAQHQITGARIAKYAFNKALPSNAMVREYIPRGRNYKILVGIGDYEKAEKTWSGGYRTFFSDDNKGVDGWTDDISETSWEVGDRKSVV